MNRLKPDTALYLGAILCLVLSTPSWSGLPDDLQAIRSIRDHGKGNAAAQAAWPNVADADATDLPQILAAMDGTGPLAANWLRAAVDTIAERTRKGGNALPTDTLEKFVLDRGHSDRPRQLAFEWLVRVAPVRRQPLLAGMLDDPALPLRYDAVASVIAKAADSDSDDERRRLYRTALDASRDIRQIQKCAKALGELDQPVNLVNHLGLITKWHVIGPFDNTGGDGFDVAYPPENGVDLDAEYDGKLGRVTWKEVETDDDMGMVDFNKLVERHKGAILYAAKEFFADEPRPAQLRLGTYNASKVWLNDRLIDANEVYHGAGFLDQYNVDAELARGRNIILLKICQNEQTESWAQTWQFQFRVCDKLGKAIHSKSP